jgi:MoxR-like ATPase
MNPKRAIKLKGVLDFTKLQFTKDNFVKMALIYYRLKSGEPVIIMGETGVGKTSLVNFLADVMDAKYLKLFMHAGVEEKEIILFIEQAIEDATS